MLHQISKLKFFQIFEKFPFWKPTIFDSTNAIELRSDSQTLFLLSDIFGKTADEPYLPQQRATATFSFLKKIAQAHLSYRYQPGGRHAFLYAVAEMRTEKFVNVLEFRNPIKNADANGRKPTWNGRKPTWIFRRWREIKWADEKTLFFQVFSSLRTNSSRKGEQETSITTQSELCCQLLH